MKTKILIVDDLKENIAALSRLIEAPDVELYTALTPDDALGLIIDHDFGLALFDVQMPVMTGFELARLVRGVEKGKHLPIIFVTAHSWESQIITEGYESGAVDLLFKPLDPQIVRSKVRVFVRLDQQSRQLQSQVVDLARLKEEAEAANIAKSRFLANMSHEIRTPLSAVLGFADILSQSDLKPNEKTEFLSSISRNGKLLLRIIDDILDVTRIEAQKLELEQAEFELAELLVDMETTLSKQASNQGISLKFNRPNGESAGPYINLKGKVVSDPLRMKQVLLNVIGNAIKFTHHGSVSVSVDTQPIDPNQANWAHSACMLRFTVRDTGMGLSPDEAEKIFEPFAQADSSTRRKYGGTGLGLAIAKQLARALGGDLVLLQSEKNRGSVFEVSFRVSQSTSSVDAHPTFSSLKSSSPASDRVIDRVIDAVIAPAIDAAILSEPVPSPKPIQQNGPLQGKRILVVDDVADNRTLIERYLRPSGAHVELVCGGQEAIDRVRSGPWDVVLMDIQMPNMDGYEATSRLRKEGFCKPIIAVTAHAMRDELDRCVKAGCDTTMTKPVTKKTLVETLSTMLN